MEILPVLNINLLKKHDCNKALFYTEEKHLAIVGCFLYTVKNYLYSHITMSLLQFIIIVAAVVFMLFGVDLYKRKKATILHFLVFLGGWAILVLFAIDNSLLNTFGQYFGVARGADLLVYISIIILFYMLIELYNSHTKDTNHLSSLISELTIQQTYQQYKNHPPIMRKKSNKDMMLFLVRAYNESSTIGGVIDEIVAAGYHKILIVNDGSTDNTAYIIEQKQKAYPDVLLLTAQHTINRGGGCANKTWFGFVSRYAQELWIQWVVTYDADGQMDVADMKDFYHSMQSKPADLYLGSRFIAWSQTDNMPWMRKYILMISRLVTRLMYGAQITDPHNGFRVISIAALEKFHITADGMHYANEINEQIRFHKMKYEEVPVHIRYTSYSLAKWQKNSNSIRLAIEMIYKKLFFR